MNILILEDDLNRIEKFKQLFKNQHLFIVSDVLGAAFICEKEKFQILLLDHDLDNKQWVDYNEENTGYQFVKWLVENQMCKDALIYIHSSNPIGANKMLNLLLDNNFDGIWFPYYLWKI